MTKEEIEADRIIESFHVALWDNGFPISKPMLKQCALIHVNGIINEYRILMLEVGNMPIEKYRYWKRVKTIIENK